MLAVKFTATNQDCGLDSSQLVTTAFSARGDGAESAWYAFGPFKEA